MGLQFKGERGSLCNFGHVQSLLCMSPVELLVIPRNVPLCLVIAPNIHVIIIVITIVIVTVIISAALYGTAGRTVSSQTARSKVQPLGLSQPNDGPRISEHFSWILPGSILLGLSRQFPRRTSILPNIFKTQGLGRSHHEGLSVRVGVNFTSAIATAIVPHMRSSKGIANACWHAYWYCCQKSAYKGFENPDVNIYIYVYIYIYTYIYTYAFV